MGDVNERGTERRYTSEESQQGQRKRDESKMSKAQAWRKGKRAEKRNSGCKGIGTSRETNSTIWQDQGRCSCELVDI